MAWMPAAQAAAVLGVSERTVWRRIKSQAIESRNENGRTLVVVDDPSPEVEDLHQLSRVACAQLSVRNMDTEGVSDILNSLAELRTALHVEVSRARRTGRWAMFMAAVLAIALGAGAWYHERQIADLREEQVAVVAGLRSEYDNALADSRAEVASAQASSTARSEEVSSLRSIGSEQRAQLSAAQATQDALQRSLDERLVQLSSAVTDDRQLAADRDREIAALRRTVTELREELHEADAKYAAMRRQSDRVTEAVRRSAARSMGLAEGLKMNLAHQRASAMPLHDALATREPAAIGDGEGSETAANFDPRGAIWASLVNQPPQPAPAADPPAVLTLLPDDQASAPLWKQLVRAWIKAWFPSPPDDANPDGLVDAE